MTGWLVVIHYKVVIGVVDIIFRARIHIRQRYKLQTLYRPVQAAIPGIALQYCSMSVAPGARSESGSIFADVDVALVIGADSGDAVKTQRADCAGIGFRVDSPLLAEGCHQGGRSL